MLAFLKTHKVAVMGVVIGILLLHIIVGISFHWPITLGSRNYSAAPGMVPAPYDVVQQPLRQQMAPLMVSSLRAVQVHCVRSNEPVRQSKEWYERMRSNGNCGGIQAQVQLSDQFGHGQNAVVTAETNRVIVTPGTLFGEVKIRVVTSTGKTVESVAPLGTNLHNIVFAVPL